MIDLLDPTNVITRFFNSERYIEAFKSNSHVGLVIAMIFFIENQNELFS